MDRELYSDIKQRDFAKIYRWELIGFDNQQSFESKACTFAIGEDRFDMVNVVIQCVHTVKALIN